MIGSRFNKWQVISDEGRDSKSNRIVLCKCDCGTEKIQRLKTITSGDSTQCKKCRMNQHNKIINIDGKRFGNSIVVKRVDNKNGNAYYLCRCDCGKEREVIGYRLKMGKSTKCPQCRIKTHGMSYTSTFKIWTGILRRCNNKNFKAYKYYGGRGIKVDERWLHFQNFIDDMGIRPEGLSIDRINNDGNYEPSNCRWATATQQSSNRRITKKLGD